MMNTHIRYLTVLCSDRVLLVVLLSLIRCSIYHSTDSELVLSESLPAFPPIKWKAIIHTGPTIFTAIAVECTVSGDGRREIILMAMIYTPTPKPSLTKIRTSQDEDVANLTMSHQHC